MLFRTATLVALALAVACDGGAEANARPAADPSDAGAWMIGPIIRGQSRSLGMPMHPTPGRNGWYIDFPRAGGKVNYVTFPHGSLAGKRRIVMRYRVDADPGVRIVPPSAPQGNSMITLYFQRGGDNWSGRGRYETYRWFATFATQSPIRPGVQQIVAPLNGNWTAIESSSARTAPDAFREALANADQVGFVLGGGDGYGHGVYATGRARLTVLEYRVE